MGSYNVTKEKLKLILQSEKTLKFLNDSSYLHYAINNSVGNVNNFIDFCFNNGDDDINIEKYDSRNIIDDIIIFNERILTRAISVKTKHFLFKSFKFRDKDEVNINNILKDVKNKLENYKYIFLILTERNRKNQPFRVRYDFYLIPMNYFDINNEHTKTPNGISSNNWELKYYKDFLLKFSREMLVTNYIGYSYDY